MPTVSIRDNFRRGHPADDAALHAVLERNLLYTGVTRGKKLVVLIAQTKAMALKNQRARKGITRLAERLGAAPAVEA